MSQQKSTGAKSDLTRDTEKLEDQIRILENLYSENKKELEKLRQHSEAIWSSVLNKLVILDAQGNIIEANSNFSDSFGVLPEFLVNKPLSEFCDSECVATLLNSKKNEFELSIDFSGSISTFLVKRTNYISFHNEPLSIFHFKNIDHEKFTQELLTQSQKQDLLGRMAGGIIHDFNNKLGAIMLTAQLAADECDEIGNEFLKANLEQILLASDKASELTAHLLSFSATENNRIKNININKVVSDYEKILYRVMGDRIEIEKDFQTDLNSIMANAAQIDQIILNLSMNARDAIRGKGKIRFKTYNLFAESNTKIGGIKIRRGNYIVLSVSDTGEGIPDNIKEKIFSPFFTTKEKGKGTGIGLATIKSIVDGLSGYIDLESSVGSGTTFAVFIPSDNVDKSLNQSDPKRITQFIKGEGRILLLDDDELILKTTEMVLKKAGYTVDACAQPEIAFELLSKNKYDLILSDAVVSGDNMKDYLQTSSKCPEILLMTGHSESTIEDFGYKHEDHDILYKPVSAKYLLSCINKKIKAN